KSWSRNSHFAGPGRHMKVAVINSSFWPREVGGVETYLTSTVQELEKHVEVVVITGPLNGPSDSVGHRSSARIVEVALRNRYPIWDWSSRNQFVRAMWHLADLEDLAVENRVSEILREEEPDIVHTHYVRGLSMSLLRTPSKLRIPHVHTIHDF